MSRNLLATLITLLADQEGVEIKYELEGDKDVCGMYEVTV